MDHAEQRDIAAGELIDLELIRRFIVVAEEEILPACRQHTCGPSLSKRVGPSAGNQG